MCLPTDKDIEDYLLLKDMLIAQRKEFDLLSKKKPDEQLNTTKIKMLNRILEPLKDLLKNEPSHKFLDIPDVDELPTNSDVVLIISQYETAISEFKDTYYLRDEYGTHTWRWMTQEEPYDYNKVSEEEDYEEYDEEDL